MPPHIRAQFGPKTGGKKRAMGPVFAAGKRGDPVPWGSAPGGL